MSMHDLRNIACISHEHILSPAVGSYLEPSLLAGACAFAIFRADNLAG